MRNDAYVTSAYSARAPYASAEDWSCGEEAYAIATNVVPYGGTFIAGTGGAWTPPGNPADRADEQHFTVTVEVEDFAKRVASKLETVCSRPKPSGVEVVD